MAKKTKASSKKVIKKAAKPAKKKAVPAKKSAKKAVKKATIPKKKAAPKKVVKKKAVAPKVKKAVKKAPVAKKKAAPKKAVKKTTATPKVKKTKVVSKPVKQPVVKKEKIKPEKVVKPKKAVIEKTKPSTPGRSRSVSKSKPGPGETSIIISEPPKQVKSPVISEKGKLELKKALLDKCLETQNNNIRISKAAMKEAQESANNDSSGSSEDYFGAFKESMQATIDLYGRQVQEGMEALALLNRIIVKKEDSVRFGTVVYTNFQNYFISIGIGEIKIDGESYVTVSTQTPLYQILHGKKKGDEFSFLDQKYKILDVF
jgi:hypothetical protein